MTHLTLNEYLAKMGLLEDHETKNKKSNYKKQRKEAVNDYYYLVSIGSIIPKGGK